jgi:hypothetical protein
VNFLSIKEVNMASGRFLIAVLFCGFAAAGCASKPQLHEDRVAATGIAAEEHIAILLSSYEREGVALASPGRENEEMREWEEVEQALESCVRREMAAAVRGLRFIPPSELRRKVFPSKSPKDLPRNPVQLLQSLSDGEPAGRAASLRLRYLVVLDGKWSTGPGSPGSAGSPVIGWGWDRYSTLYATVLDLTHRRVAGEISASSRGPAGWGVGIVWIIPVPFFIATQPESRACAGLGEALARFIAQ